jgi:protein involved in polysaccharide export with SLBB domain
MNLRTSFAALLTSLMLVIPAFPQAEIKAGKAIQITIQGVPVAEKAKVDGLYPVGVNGTINMPFLNQPIRAAGLRPEQLAQSIQSAYIREQIYRNPTVQVFGSDGEAIDVQQVHVGGRVKAPGPTKFVEGLTLWQAIQAAGGATEFGSMKRVKLYRGKSQNQYDLTQPKFMQIPLKPGDTIEVPQKGPFGG